MKELHDYLDAKLALFQYFQSALDSTLDIEDGLHHSWAIDEDEYQIQWGTEEKYPYPAYQEELIDIVSGKDGYVAAEIASCTGGSNFYIIFHEKNKREFVE